MNNRRLFLVLAALWLFVNQMNGQDLLWVTPKPIDNNSNDLKFTRAGSVQTNKYFFSVFKDPFNLLDADKLWSKKNKNTHQAAILGFFNDGAGSVYTTLLNDNFGPLHVSFSAGVNTDQKDTTADLKTFLTNGGNANLTGTLPFFVLAPTKTSYHFSAGMYMKPTLFFVVPKLGGYTDNLDFGGRIQLETQASITGKDTILGINASAIVGVAGGTGPWQKNLLYTNQDVFGYGMLSFGIMLTKQYTLRYTYTFDIGQKNGVFTQQKPLFGLTANF